MRGMSRVVVALAAVALSLVGFARPSSAVQAYGDGWTVYEDGATSRAITSCWVDGIETHVRTPGGGEIGVERLRIIRGTQDQYDNQVMAHGFRKLAAGTGTGTRVASCRIRYVDGVRRMVVTTTGGARWALIRPYVGPYYYSWIAS